MINRLLSLMGMLTLGYLLFCVPIAGMNLAAHLADLWRSDCVQQKVRLIGDEVRKKDVSKMAREALDRGMKLAPPAKDPARAKKNKHPAKPAEKE